ncbi:MAG: SDR family NAD(P)-dependent oxidoreductase [Pseudomonadota bacterium]
MSDIRFDGKVAIITGAGNGLGKSHALALAARGAKVVVNDLGGARDGTGGSLSAAETVVEEITASGGEAIANGANVTKSDEVEAMVKQAMDAWGRVDILVNNAGILRDKSFAKMELSDFQLVVDVHLMGTVNCTKAVWPIMRDQAAGCIVVTTSSSGLYGNFGQSNYGAAKLGVVGLMNTLVLEGAKYNIRVNALSPVALTRMTEDLGFNEEAADLLTPEAVTAGLVWLVSDDGPNRFILDAGAGGYARTVIVQTDGAYLKTDEQTPENVAALFEKIDDRTTVHEHQSGAGQSVNFFGKASEAYGKAMTRR